MHESLKKWSRLSKAGKIITQKRWVAVTQAITQEGMQGWFH